jgi:hypothetical protein
VKHLEAIHGEIARERATGHVLDAVRVTHQAMRGSIVAAPVLHGSFTGPAQRRAFDGALAQLAGNPRRVLLIHPDDWAELLLEQPFTGDVCMHEVLGLPVEHA